MNRLLLVASVGIMTFSSLGCSLEPASTATLFVDNPRKKAMAVLVDGKSMATIAPGTSQCISVDLGVRHIQFESDGAVIYSIQHEFEPNDIPLLPGSYLVSPEDSVCYCYTTATYGHDQEAKELKQLINGASSRDIDTPREDLVPRFKYLLEDMRVFEANEPTRFQAQLYTLKPLPNSVKASRHAVKRDRSAVIRIPREIHDLIVKLGEVEIPSERDMKQAAKLRLTVDALIPFES